MLLTWLLKENFYFQTRKQNGYANMKKTDIWMPLYVADYLADTGHLTVEQHGAYFLLMCHQWRAGSIPADPSMLAKITRCSLKVWKARIENVVLAFFDRDGDVFVQKRLKAEAMKSDANRAKKAIAAAAKWNRREEIMGGGLFPLEGKTSQTENVEIIAGENNENNNIGDAPAYADGLHVDMQKGCPSPSPSPSPSERKKESKKEPPQTSFASPHEKSTRTGSRLPDNWVPTEADENFAASHLLNIEETAAKFRDYWIAQPGQRGRKSDWSATWRNWCRKEAENRKNQSKQRPFVNGFAELLHNDIQAERRKTVDPVTEFLQWEKSDVH
jgi:uncharacterized protein YdaU (DUF1376 family)